MPNKANHKRGSKSPLWIVTLRFVRCVGSVITKEAANTMDSDVALQISYRFLSLTDAQALGLKKEFSRCQFGKHFSTGEITASLELEHTDIGKLAAFVRENAVEPGATDIFISFVTEYDSRIIDIPPYVNKAIRETGSKLVVSYTVV